MKKFSKINVQDYDLSRVQDAIDQAFNPLIDIKLLDGILLENVSVITTGSQVLHKLGRKPRLWYVVRKLATGDIWETASDTKTLTLQSSSNLTVSLWVA